MVHGEHKIVVTICRYGIPHFTNHIITINKLILVTDIIHISISTNSTERTEITNQTLDIQGYRLCVVYIQHLVEDNRTTRCSYQNADQTPLSFTIVLS